ncbi:DUF2953 domain-containing protein [Bacillus sp. FJAT-45350]|uniref:DUF2953 domain-containing protein n=1 Tax=Bacillus sp. FJAT-45350 TaxID=2011014 RepID=UPI000BB9470C|nr:DUF2953 domain-containing protein [Bacillus sp. FJAT-45350]
MTWIWISAAIILFLLLFLAITKITVTISYVHNADDDLLNIVVKAWGIRLYKLSAPLIKIDENSPSIIVEEEQEIGSVEQEKKVKITVDYIIKEIRKMRDFLEHVVGFHTIVRRFLGHITVHKFEWKSLIGVSDASHTGIVAGVVWSLKGGIVGIVGNYMKIKEKPIIMIQPHFQAMISKTDLKCIISFRIGHAIKAGLLIVKHWKRRPIHLKTAEEHL